MTPRLPPNLDQLSHRVLMVPVRASAASGSAQGDGRPLDAVSWHSRLHGPLCVAHAAARPVTVCWARMRARGPMLVLVGGAQAGDGDDCEIAYPPGVRGRRADPAQVHSTLSAFTWQQCQLALDATLEARDSIADRLEDVFSLSGQPMAYLVTADPMSDAQLGSRIDRLSDELVELEALRVGRGVHRRRLARVAAELEYLDRSAGIGCWQLRLWVGASRVADAAAAAGMIAGSADLSASPVLVRRGSADASGQLEWSDSANVGIDVVAALARPPFVEMPGVRVTSIPEFDHNVEDRVEVKLGAVLDPAQAPTAPFGVSLASLNRHVLVTGATGSGKSESVRTLLLALHERGLPWWVIEPAKAEYAALAPWLDPGNPMIVIRPGDPSVPPPLLNPLEPSSVLVQGTRQYFPLQTHLDLVRALFTAAFDAEDPFPQVLSSGLARAYQSRGWNLVTGAASDPGLSAPQWPVLADLVRESLAAVEQIGYQSEVQSNVRGFIRVRVESLRTGTPGRFFEGGYPLDLAELLTQPVVFEIEDLGDDRDKAFFMGNLIIRLVELLRLRDRFGLRPAGLGHVLVIEEAHRLLRRVPDDSPSAQAVTMFANLLAEIRGYGEGVVVAEQIPTKVIPDLIKNSAVKLMHRLPAADDREAVGATMNLDGAQSKHVVSLEPGTAVAHGSGMDRPVLVRMDRVGDLPARGTARSAPTLGPRSTACPADCAGRWCSLGELETARDLVTAAVALWVEVFVICCLTWDPPGQPRGRWWDRLRAAPPRTARCAVGLAVADSVARRSQLIRRWHDPQALQADIANRLSAQVATDSVVQRGPWKWAVGGFRLNAVARKLAEADAGVVSEPHPQTGRWRAVGIDLPGPTWADQLDQLAQLRRSLPLVPSLELAGTPPVLDELAQALGYHTRTPAQRIPAAIAGLGLEHRWVPIRTGVTDE